MSNEDNITNKTSLIDYLLKVAHLTSRVVKDIVRYDVIWFYELEDCSNCTLKDWTTSNAKEELIKIRHISPPSPPQIPQICKEWIANGLAYIEDRGEKGLTPKFAIFHVDPSENEKQKKQKEMMPLSISQLRSTWDEYIEMEWKPWKTEYEKWKHDQDFYEKFYSLYQKQQKSSEQYELCLGLGLLQYKDKEGRLVRRHLLTVSTEFRLNAEKAELFVEPQEMAEPQLELDIFGEALNKDTEDRARRLLEEDISLTAGNIEKIIKLIINLTFSNGEYRYQLARLKTEEIKDIPIVTFSPAVILRNRSTRGIIRSLEDIKKQLKDGVKTSEIFTALTDNGNQDESDKIKDKYISSDSDYTLFFPKPYNDEQRAIVKEINRFNGVVVQGPPGTGKSHTIANLMCHMLATGKRILVTAKTSTALSVLRNLLPENIRYLAINVLGENNGEREWLESSIRQIIQKSNGQDDKRKLEKIEELQQKLDSLKREQSEKYQQLRAIIESETYSHSVACARYSGTATQIAKEVNGEQSDYSWFCDQVSLNKEFSLSLEELFGILSGMRKFHGIKNELSLYFEDVMSSENFCDLVVELNKIKIPDIGRMQGNRTCSELSTLSAEELNLICEQISAFEQEAKRLTSYGMDWVKRELDKILIDTANYENQKKLECLLLDLNKVASKFAGHKVIYPSEYSRDQIISAAKILKDFLSDKGIFNKLNLKILMPKYVKESVNILEKVKIDQRPCRRHPEDLEVVINSLNFLSKLDEAKYLSDEFTEIPEQLPLYQLRSIEKINKVLLELSKAQNLFKKYIFTIKTKFKVTEDETLENVKLICRYLIFQKHKKRLLAPIIELKKRLEEISIKNDIHKVMLDLLEAVKNFNTDDYHKSKLKLNNLLENRNELSVLRKSIEKIVKVIPKTIREMLHSYTDPTWNDKIKLLEKAWYWSQANSWLTNYINSENISVLKTRLKQIEEGIQSALCELVEMYSWKFCSSRLTQLQRQHIEMWYQAVKKVGKGTGKYAQVYIKAAQEHLNGCREAIPAWIMPLHKVWDNVRIAPELFDVVIVDEASQCGVEALPLFYITKKIIIVGDDKQISPENVGLDQGKALQLKKEYLDGLDDLKDCFDVGNSLFDIGKTIFSTNNIVLREHFRCMPEIIQFSIDLCYSHTPLIPLKQFGLDRLQPLDHVFIQNGYVQGENSNIKNEPEAEAIVNKISQMCADEKYNGKSIGVIVLQGQQQVNLIEKKLLKNLGEKKINDYHIKCAAPPQFQGDERDVILLSMVAAPDKNNSKRLLPLTKSVFEQRFNVAMSRAKEQVILFHSIEAHDLNPNCLRRRLIEFFEKKSQITVEGIPLNELEKQAYLSDRCQIDPPAPFDSWFEVDVALEIAKKGYHVVPQYEVAGRRIDIVVEGNNSKIAVECDGEHWHGADHYEQDMQRQRLLERCGWDFFRIPSSTFYYNKNRALEKLWLMLQERNIFPGL